jgi:hypothetical protein
MVNGSLCNHCVNKSSTLPSRIEDGQKVAARRDPLAIPAEFRGKIGFAAPPDLWFWIERKTEGGGAR